MDLIRVYPGALPTTLCRQLITGFEALEAEHIGRAGDDPAAPRFTELNLTQSWQQGHEQVFEAILPLFERYSRDLAISPAQWPADLAFEELRIKRYHHGGDDQFPEHVDVGDHASARRFLAALIYLNDVEEGGHTEFPGWGLKISPRVGTAVLFPPLWPWLHAGRPPISESKYILSTYLHYT
jgi:hypothetical protein